MYGLVIFFIILVIVFSVIKKQVRDNPKVEKGVSFLRIVAYLGIGISIILSCLVQIGPGEIGVPILFGGVQDNVLRSGLNIVNPLVSVEKLDVKTQAYTMSGVKDEGAVKGDDAIITLSQDGNSLVPFERR
jgi:regulator of protease activity HflC (stomatin/prohibitin superfamily)